MPCQCCGGKGCPCNTEGCPQCGDQQCPCGSRECPCGAAGCPCGTPACPYGTPECPNPIANGCCPGGVPQILHATYSGCSSCCGCCNGTYELTYAGNNQVWSGGGPCGGSTLLYCAAQGSSMNWVLVPSCIGAVFPPLNNASSIDCGPPLRVVFNSATVGDGKPCCGSNGTFTCNVTVTP